MKRASLLHKTQKCKRYLTYAFWKVCDVINVKKALANKITFLGIQPETFITLSNLLTYLMSITLDSIITFMRSQALRVTQTLR